MESLKEIKKFGNFHLKFPWGYVEILVSEVILRSLDRVLKLLKFVKLLKHGITIAEPPIPHTEDRPPEVKPIGTDKNGDSKCFL